MKVIEYGTENRDVIVLLHGGGLSWWSYRKAAALLADRYRVVLPVLDGHSGSETPFESIEKNADRIIEHIDAHFGGHVLMIGGLSLGGQIAAEILSQRAAICDYAVLESVLAVRMPMTAALVGPMLSVSYPLVKKRWFAKLQFRALRILPELFEEYYRDSAGIFQRDMAAFLAANSDYSPKETLCRCGVKTLVLAGSRERPIMRKSARLLAKKIPDAEVRILKGFRHGELSINHPDMFAELLLRLMNR